MNQPKHRQSVSWFDDWRQEQRSSLLGVCGARLGILGWLRSCGYRTERKLKPTWTVFESPGPCGEDTAQSGSLGLERRLGDAFHFDHTGG